MYRLFFILALIFFMQSCQKKPNISGSLDNFSPLLYPPMGDKTFNDELKKELTFLDELFLGTLDKNLNTKVKTALMNGQKNDFLPLSNEKYLSNLYLTLPELVFAAPAEKKDWFKAKYLFLKRRFAESATLLSEILKKEPGFYKAKNFRARAIFFLGNPDLAIKELFSIAHAKDVLLEDKIDALYLVGAIVHESEDLGEEKNKQAIKAWEEYLTLSSDKNLVFAEVKKSLGELRDRLIHKNTPVKIVEDIFSPHPSYSKQKNDALKAFNKEEYLLALQLIKDAGSENDKELNLTKARIFLKTGQHDEAFLLFDEIAKKYPKFPAAWHYRGMSFMLKGKVKEAVESWQKVFELDKSYALHHKLDQRISIAQKMLGPQKIDTH